MSAVSHVGARSTAALMMSLTNFLCVFSYLVGYRKIPLSSARSATYRLAVSTCELVLAGCLLRRWFEQLLRALWLSIARAILPPRIA
jgi:hypothetical protein